MKNLDTIQTWTYLTNTLAGRVQHFKPEFGLTSVELNDYWMNVWMCVLTVTDDEFDSQLQASNSPVSGVARALFKFDRARQDLQSTHSACGLACQSCPTIDIKLHKHGIRWNGEGERERERERHDDSQVLIGTLLRHFDANNAQRGLIEVWTAVKLSAQNDGKERCMRAPGLWDVLSKGLLQDHVSTNFRVDPSLQQQVNGDDPVAVTSAFELAAEWRQTWQTDATYINPLKPSFEFVWSSEGLRRMWGWPENRVTSVNRTAKAAKDGKMVKVLPCRTAWTCLLVWIQRRLTEVTKPRGEQGWTKFGSRLGQKFMRTSRNIPIPQKQDLLAMPRLSWT